ncbi:GlmU family protein [Pedobacter puniceum]|uniref:Glucose-1-phosphate thymidylyltransferase n=1 Tax=Pedobacter puniceum TaxID=2666136 RepID=A0A7K0FR09_9SPHI|nr:GlmU family protein [Pedobacter puniceum]MRX48414.1 glucose-1-phosphate thymidylyltransferase [Pedobacter puniceum]
MAVILFDDQSRESLSPLTFTRPVADLRIGILTISKKWEHYLHQQSSYLTEDYLKVKFPTIIEAHNIFVNGSILPNQSLLEAIDALKEAELLIKDSVVLAIKLVEADARTFNLQDLGKYARINFEGTFTKLLYPEDIFKYNDQEIRADFDLLTKNRTSATLSSTNTIIGEHIFVEEGVEAECSSFNTKNGPIYLGKNAQVWEGTHIRGSFALCHDSQVKMGGKIYGGTTIGPYSRVGGEINNAVIWGHSSKGHDGYLGNSVLGEWCNIGADSNNSNLKNNYDEVKLWDYNSQRFRKTGLQFCGLIMADHAKCGINTMFNTGTVVGVSANIFGAGFPRNFVPDFAWGGSHGFEVYQLKKMFTTAEEVFKRRNSVFNDVEKDILTHIFNNTEAYRRF